MLRVQFLFIIEAFWVKGLGRWVNGLDVGVLGLRG